MADQEILLCARKLEEEEAAGTEWSHGCQETPISRKPRPSLSISILGPQIMCVSCVGVCVKYVPRLLFYFIFSPCSFDGGGDIFLLRVMPFHL